MNPPRPRLLSPFFLLLSASLLVAFLASPARSEEAETPAAATPGAATSHPVDLVLCLDTSGSMQGLIDSARQKLWSVVSELAIAQPTPDLRVALLTYGGPGHDDTGHVIVQSDLTRDLDLISEKLFALGTRGGDEYVGRVVWHALEHLSWAGKGALRVLFVAGNESADQDRIRPFREQAKLATERGVVVNAVYCGGPDDADAAGYRDLAALAHGRYATIDQDHGTVAVATPFDEELAKLSSGLSGTYVAYGDKADEMRERQAAQDANAQSAGAPAAAERAEAKAGRLYRNAWDLVERMGEEGFDLDQVPVEDLPEEMRKMTPDERRAFLLAKKDERVRLQTRIRELGVKRDAFVRDEMAKRHLDDASALDRALRDAIREEAKSAGFRWN